MKLSNANSNIIDVIRIIAAWMVLCGHIWNKELHDIGIVLTLQNAGVVILFILAGFLTAMSIRKHNINRHYTVTAFAINRIHRLLPGLIIALLTIVVIDLIHVTVSPDSYLYRDTFDFIHFSGNILFLQDYPIIGDYIMAFASGRPLWTLSLEFWLYIGIGTLYIWIDNRENLKWYEYALLGISLIPVISNLSNESRGGGLTIAFAFGFIIYLIYEIIPYYIAVGGAIVTFAIWIMLAFKIENPYTIWYFFLSATLFCFLMRLGDAFELKRVKILSSISGYTYLLYLTHYSIMELFCGGNIMGDSIANKVFTFVASNIFAIVLYYFAELPLRKYINIKTNENFIRNS